jgi:hypothetical protein
MSNLYNEFVSGFLKLAEEEKCDVDFLKGYIKQADEIVDIWTQAFDVLAKESGDPQYKVKLANEIIRFTQLLPQIHKQADLQDTEKGYENFLGGLNNGGLSQGQNWLEHQSWMPQFIQQALHNNPNLLSSLLSGSMGGGLGGLLIGALLGHPMSGLMLGGLGGAASGAFLGNQGIRDMFNSGDGVPKPTTPQELPDRAPSSLNHGPDDLPTSAPSNQSHGVIEPTPTSAPTNSIPNVKPISPVNNATNTVPHK